MRHLWWIVPCAIAQVVLLAEVARRDLKAGRRFEGALALSTLSASCIGLWALTRVRDDILDHEIFWLAAFGAINLAVLGAAGLRASGTLAERMRAPPPDALETRVGGPRAATSACALALVLGLSLGVRDLRDLTSFELRRAESVTIVAAYESIRNYVRAEGIRKPLIAADEPLWGHAAGVLLRLQQDGTPAGRAGRVAADVYQGLRGDGRRGRGRHHRYGRDCSRERSARPGNVLLLERRAVFVDAIRIAPGQVR